MLDGYRWERIAGPVAEAFNRRLKQEGRRAGTWTAGETPLAPHFGKELTLLAWAVEDADPTLIPNVVANWTGLAPEERWWFFTTINATAGHPEHGRDRGWRKAIKIALADNPTFEPPPSALLVGPMPAPEPDPDPAGQPSRRGKRKGPPDTQGRLFD